MHLGKCVGVGMVAALALATLSPSRVAMSRARRGMSAGWVSASGRSVMASASNGTIAGRRDGHRCCPGESGRACGHRARGRPGRGRIGFTRSPSDFEQAQARITPGGAVSVAIARSKGRIIDIVKVHYDETPTPATADSPQESGQPAVTSETAVTSTEAAPVPVPSQTAPAPAGAPTMPTLGVQCETLGADLAAALDVSMDHGVVVLAVTKDGPAELAGIRGRRDQQGRRKSGRQYRRAGKGSGHILRVLVDPDSSPRDRERSRGASRRRPIRRRSRRAGR